MLSKTPRFQPSFYHVPNQGTCIATSEDDDLIHWTPSPENPVIPIPEEPQEYHVFDPCAWYENGTYYALIGNKNSRPGYEGDATSLFRSDDCMQWEYRGPFYKSSRRWTDEVEDCACPDFFPLEDKYMLLMHGHPSLWYGTLLPSVVTKMSSSTPKYTDV